MDLLWLCLCAFFAGLVDSIVGGGGLIQLPALFIFLPPDLAASIPIVFGTNKLSSMCGTSVAVARYARHVAIPWASILPSALVAFALSALGARAVQLVPADFLKPLVLVLLAAVAAYTCTRKEFGRLHAPRFIAGHERLAAMGVGAVIGFYDGFFGPGTGSFLMFIFVGIFGFDFLTATASGNVINLATNAAAVLIFALAGCVRYDYALPMGVCNVAGALVGTRLALLRGNHFIRIVFLAVVAAMLARMGWEQWR